MLTAIDRPAIYAMRAPHVQPKGRYADRRRWLAGKPKSLARNNKTWCSPFR